MLNNILKPKPAVIEKWILLLFFFSGTCGLIYQTAWTRLLNQIYGSTVYAVSTILAAFMAGLAIGSYFLGRVIDVRKNPIRFYAFLELGIGLFALISPLLLGNLNPVYVWVYQHLADYRPLYLLTLFAITFTFLLIPTIMMGGTLPVLSKFFVKRREALGRKIGNLYSVNTFGAMFGCFATGFLLIGTIGIKWTIYLSAFINLLIFIILLAGSRYFTAIDAKDSIEIDKTKQTKGKLLPNRTVLLILFAFSLSGFAALGYEVVWFRGLIFYLGNSTWAFTTMLTIFLGGLAFGSLLIRKTCDKKENLLEIFAWVEIIIGLTAALTIPVLGGVLNFHSVFDLLAKLSSHWLTKICGLFTISLIVMFIPALLMGSAFPLVSRICVRNLKRVGGEMGIIYSANTVGAILGSIAGGFILIPLVGILRSILYLSLVNIIVGWIVLVFNRNLSRRYKYSASFLLLIFVLLSHTIFPSKVKFRSEFEGKKDQLLFYCEDAVATTKVFQKPNGNKLMSIDGHPVGGTAYNIDKKQKLLAHLPLLLSKDPKSVFVVGLGTGITLGSIVHYQELESIEVAEIVPGVIKGAEYFNTENGRCLQNPKVNVLLGDGVNYLKNTTKKYDVISSDAKCNPEFVGNTTVLSADYYQICLQRLEEQGIMCQWIPFDLPENEYLSVLKTFSSVFPHTTLWYLGWTESLLLGSKEKLTIDFKAMEEKMKNPDIRKELGKFNLDNPYVLLSTYICDEKELKKYSQNAPINSWNRPYIEFHAPMDFASKQRQGIIVDRLQKFIRMQGEILAYLYNLGDNDEQIQSTEDNLKSYRLLAEKMLTTAIAQASDELSKKIPKPYSTKIQKYIDKGTSLLETEHYQEAINEFKIALEKAGDLAEIHSKLGYAYMMTERFNDSIQALNRAIEINPNLEEAYNFLSVVYKKMGRLEDALRTYQRLTALQPQNHTAHYNLGVIYHEMGMYQKEILEYKHALKIEPDYALALYNMGIWYGNKGMYDDAIYAFKKLVAIDPNNAQARYNLAIAFTKKNEYQEAEFQYKKAIEIEPNFSSARRGLESVEKRLGKREPVKKIGELRVQHILVRTRSEAEEILNLLNKGHSFTNLAKQKSIDPSAKNGGDLGFFRKGDLLPDFENAALRLKIGEISGIVKTRLGYHIIQRTG